VGDRIQSDPSKWVIEIGSYYLAFCEVPDEDRLPPVEKGKYIISDSFTLGDITVVPFLRVTILIQFKNGLREFDKEEAKRGWENFRGPKHERIRQYIDDIAVGASRKSTFDEVRVREVDLSLVSFSPFRPASSRLMPNALHEGGRRVESVIKLVTAAAVVTV